MKYFLRIKRIRISPKGEMIISLRCGIDVYRDGKNVYTSCQTGEIMEPVFDEFTDELIGFVADNIPIISNGKMKF